MEEKVLNKKKNGMAMMLLFIALYIAAAILMCIGVDHSKPLCVVSVIYLGIGTFLCHFCQHVVCGSV